MIAIMFSFTKGLGMQRLLLDKIGMEKVHLEVANAEGEDFEFRVLQPVKDEEGNIKSRPDGFAHLMPEPVQKAMIGILTYAEHTNFAALGLVGSFMLLVSVITSIAKLEDCFNRIWGVTKPRSLLKKISEYLIVLILAPLVFVLVTTMNSILMSAKILGAFDQFAGAIAGLMVMLMRLGSCFLVLLMFAFFYMFMPHTKVTDDGADGEGRFMDGHAQRAFGAAGDAMEHAVCVGMCAEDAGYGDEHDDGGGARREAEEKHVDGQ